MPANSRFNLRASMRDDLDLLKIMNSVEDATPPLPEPLPPEKWSVFYIPVPDVRRAMNLARYGRLDTFEDLAAMLADCTDTPWWLARMAMNAAVPIDHETELDDAENHLPMLSRAAEAMGLDPACVATIPRYQPAAH